jgi:hypothetical protein
MIKTLCFLTYIARSGSTLLAKELDKYRSIGVTIEEDIPDGLLEGEEVFIKNLYELDIYLDNLFSKPKFQFWNIDREKLRAELAKDEYPIDIGAILRKLYKFYFSDTKYEVGIHKKGRYYLKIDELLKYFPDAKFIHLKRDPRGLFNSQKKSRDSRTGKLMSNNVVAFALSYRKMYNIMKFYNKFDYLYSLRYEDLIDNFDKEMHEILDFLGVTNREKEDIRYYNKIPDPQKELHNNIQQPPLKERKSGWEKELSALEIAVLEACLKKEIRKEGYCFSRIKPGNIGQKVRFIERVSVFYLKYYLAKLIPGPYRKLKNVRENLRNR